MVVILLFSLPSLLSKTCKTGQQRADYKENTHRISFMHVAEKLGNYTEVHGSHSAKKSFYRKVSMSCRSQAAHNFKIFILIQFPHIYSG